MTDTLAHRIIRAIKLMGPLTSGEVLDNLRLKYPTSGYKALKNMTKLNQLELIDGKYHLTQAAYTFIEPVDMFPIPVENFFGNPLIKYFARLNAHGTIDSMQEITNNCGINEEKLQEVMLETLLLYCCMNGVRYFDSRREIKHETSNEDLEEAFKILQKKFQ